MKSNIEKMYNIFFLFLLIFIVGGCKKYLDEKPSNGLDIPDKLIELQGLLDRYNYLNVNDPGPDEVSADDYYLTNADWASQSEDLRRLYTWEKDNLFPLLASDWTVPYTIVFNANTVINSIDNIRRESNNQVEWDNIKGQAFFWRAKCFFQIANIWAKQYDKSTATNDMGIPLRLTTDFNAVSTRASVEDSYHQIISDLKKAIPILALTPRHVMRPSKPAATAILARVYLSMGEYDSCLKYSNLTLQFKSTLMNFNNSADINPAATFPFKRFNTETVFYSSINTPSILNNTRAKVDSILYQTYDVNDLRRSIYFRNNNNGTFGFKGTYTESIGLFTGVAIDEVYLMSAECNARLGKIGEALTLLNNLLVTRWKAGTFQPFSASTQGDALTLILKERRKELLMRGVRWMDLKRLNKTGLNIVLKRVINGQEYILSPNDARYVLPIPDDVIALSGMPQNPR